MRSSVQYISYQRNPLLCPCEGGHGLLPSGEWVYCLTNVACNYYTSNIIFQTWLLLVKFMPFYFYTVYKICLFLGNSTENEKGWRLSHINYFIPRILMMIPQNKDVRQLVWTCMSVETAVEDSEFCCYNRGRYKLSCKSSFEQNGCDLTPYSSLAADCGRFGGLLWRSMSRLRVWYCILVRVIIPDKQ